MNFMLGCDALNMDIHVYMPFTYYLGSGRLLPGGGVGKSWWGSCNFFPLKEGGCTIEAVTSATN